MMRQILGSCLLVFVTVGVSFGQTGDNPAFPPIIDAPEQPQAPADNQPSAVGNALVEPQSTVPDPQAYDSANQRFDTGPAQAEPAPQPIPVFSLLPNLKVLLGGTATADFVYTSQRAIAPGTPFLLTPASPTGASTQTFNAIARQSALFAVFQGPEICDFESGGLVAAN